MSRPLLTLRTELLDMTHRDLVTRLAISGAPMRHVLLSLVLFAACSCARRPPPRAAFRAETPRYAALATRPLKVEIIDHAGLFSSGTPSLVERVSERLAAGGVTVSSSAPRALRLELSLTQRPAQGDAWCVRVAGDIDSGQPAFMPRQQRESTRCATITPTKGNSSVALGAALWLAADAITGADAAQTAELRAAALAASIDDVLDQLGSGPAL